MNKSLGDFKIEKSSSYNFGNILWTMKNKGDIKKLKSRGMDLDKKFQNSSASNCNIKQGFKRPGR